MFATNVAESSITLKGFVYVIDTALSYISRYYPRSDVDELAIRVISKASHMQRRGRVGRVGPGVCYNIFS